MYNVGKWLKTNTTFFFIDKIKQTCRKTYSLGLNILYNSGDLIIIFINI